MPKCPNVQNQFPGSFIIPIGIHRDSKSTWGKHISKKLSRAKAAVCSTHPHMARHIPRYPSINKLLLYKSPIPLIIALWSMVYDSTTKNYLEKNPNLPK